MLDGLKSALEGLRRHDSRGDAALANLLPRVEDDGGDDDRADEPTNLFRCESCGTVYIDTERETCSECDAPVARVDDDALTADHRDSP